MSAVKVCHFCGINSLKQKKIKGKYDKALNKSLKEMKVTSGKHSLSQIIQQNKETSKVILSII